MCYETSCNLTMFQRDTQHAGPDQRPDVPRRDPRRPKPLTSAEHKARYNATVALRPLLLLLFAAPTSFATILLPTRRDTRTIPVSATTSATKTTDGRCLAQLVVLPPPPPPPPLLKIYDIYSATINATSSSESQTGRQKRNHASQTCNVCGSKWPMELEGRSSSPAPEGVSSVK